MKRILFLAVLLLFIFNAYAQKKITVDNMRPRTDVNGDTIDLHDGRVIKFGKRFYWYGTSYGNTTGFVRTNEYNCYSSPDLMDWRKEGTLFNKKPSGIYYRPHVIYNEKTKKYVLWYNWYPKLWNGKFGVAVSDYPQGPFEIVNTDVQVSHSALGVGDFGLFVDDDKTAYIVYNTISGHQNSVERLSDDYLSSSLENGGFIAKGCEAGAIFKRKNLYYLLTDFTCCFCMQGSGAQVYVSDDPLKGYQLRNNINRFPGTSAPGLIDGLKTPTIYESLQRNADSTFVPVQINFPSATKFNSVKVYVFTGNRNGMCGDTLATKVHEKIITPAFELFVLKNLQWEKVEAAVSVERSSVFNVVRFDLDQVNSHAVLFKPVASNPNKVIYVNEIEIFDGDKKITQAGHGAEAFLLDTNPMQTKPVIPAQQTYVMPLETKNGTQFIWMGDLWGSASNNVKGHDYQYWGAPLEFDIEGNIMPMRWTDSWTTKIIN